MICLGIESTAHTFGIGIIDEEGNVLANAKDTFTTTEGGLNPTDVAQHHRDLKDNLLKQALEEAKLDWKDIDVVAFSQSPGLPPCLLVGLEFAKELAKQHNKPLVGVNHMIAHLTIGNLMTGAKDPVYLYVSGPNTQVIALAGDRYRVFGETVDIGLGNALDKFARIIGLGFPGGPKIEKLATGKYIELPYAVKGMDVSFAGMITKAQRLYEQGEAKEDLCFSLQETAFAMLAEVAERAMAHIGKNELCLIGGVAANQKLCSMLKTMCGERNAKFFPVPLKYSGDQGVMIAWQGLLRHKAGDSINIDSADFDATKRIDEVEVIWCHE